MGAHLVGRGYRVSVLGFSVLDFNVLGINVLRPSVCWIIVSRIGVLRNSVPGISVLSSELSTR